MLQRWWEMITTTWLTYWSAWALFLGYLAATYCAAWLLQRFTKRVVLGLAARTTTRLDDRLAQVSDGSVRSLVQAVGLRLALEVLSNRIPAFQLGGSMATEFRWAERIALALVVLAATHLINGVVTSGISWYIKDVAMGNEGAWNNELLPMTRRILSLVLYFIAATIILRHFDQDITALVTTAGIASLAVALAAQDTLSNMLGGFVILADRPFKVGDAIELSDDKSGEVIEIGLRSTRIRLPDGNALVVPNKDLANARITNLALPTARVAIRQTICVDPSSDVEQTKRVLREALLSHDEILKEPAPAVWFTRFGEKSLDMLTICWIDSYRDRTRIVDALNTRILQRLRAAGIQLPQAHREVILAFHEPDRIASSSAEGNSAHKGERYEDDSSR